jgi:hypothetical protein
VAGHYQTLLSLNLAIFGLAAGGLAGLYQLTVAATSPPVARIAVRNFWSWLLLALLVANFAVALSGSVFLSAPHDVVPGSSFHIDNILSSPIVAGLSGAATIAAALCAAAAIAVGARVLQPVPTAQLILDHWDGAAVPNEDARLDAVMDLARRALHDGRLRDYSGIVSALFARLRLIRRSDDPRAMLDGIVEAHLIPLTEEAVRYGRFDQVALLTRSVRDLVIEEPDEGLLDAALTFAILSSEQIFITEGRRAFGLTIEVISSIGAEAARHGWDATFDNVCRATGAIGERVPSVFLSPDDPEVLLGTDVAMRAAGDPLASLTSGFEELLTAAWPQGGRPLLDLLIWRDGVVRSAEALVAHIDRLFHDRRLELPLLRLVMLLSALIKRSAEEDEWRTLWYIIISLAKLAEDADHAYFHEYPQDLAGWLIEAGMRAEAEDAEVPGDGEKLATIAAQGVAQNLAGHAGAQARNLLNAGIVAPVPQPARWQFVKSLGVLCGDNFGLRFDPATGADLFGPASPS